MTIEARGPMRLGGADAPSSLLAGGLRLVRTECVQFGPGVQEAFLQFVKSWAEWIGSLDLDRRLAAAA